ncbi:oligopeptide/dipeptide ABC transporter ATP-binding protein [uncultured Nisaea sp.]|uniref:ABC transporter ATP-binding protein n=1 Tax=uncultured Nisaea sp. TaxID=538215 RepID=UPI0030ED6AE6|tara:strand:- start:6356 stop:7324 length:969 start_codon:yes stop_codon:yes gene_type:complete
MTGQTPPPVLEMRDVTKTYMIRRGIFSPKQPLHAVNGISLKINKGDVLGLVGESGCGKSTLAKILLGLELPSTGEIFIDGETAHQSGDRKAISRRIQPIFQDPYSSLNPRKTIGSIVSLPLRVHKVGDPSTWRKAVEDILDIVGLPRRVYDSYPNQLSGGQRQRVAIARALIMKPEIVICDEPTSALDVSVQSQILNLLMDLREELNLTYVLISHNLAVVEHIATKVAVMYLGRIVEETGTDKLFEASRHPYTGALLSSVLTPEPGLGVPDSGLGIAFPNPINPPSGCTFHPRCAKAFGPCPVEKPPVIQDADGRVECHLYA